MYTVKVASHTTIYDSSEEPIMLILSNKDKGNISNMHKDANKFISFPDDKDLKYINKWSDQV